MPNFADQLSAARKEAGLTQEQLADAVHVARNTISSWERGRTRPDLQTMLLLGELLHFDFVKGEAAAQTDDEVPAEASEATCEGSGQDLIETLDKTCPEGFLQERSDAGAHSHPMDSGEETPAQKLLTGKNIIIAAAALAAVILIVCLLVIPRLSAKPAEYKNGSGKVYTIADYQAVTPNEAGKAYLSISTTLTKEPTSSGGQFMYSFLMKEENGIGFTIERMEHINFFYSTDIISIDSFTGDDVRAWGDDPEIKPHGTYQMDCGINAKTPSGTPNAIGAAFQVWGTDANGEQLTFTAYIPLPQD